MRSLGSVIAIGALILVVSAILPAPLSFSPWGRFDLNGGGLAELLAILFACMLGLVL